MPEIKQDIRGATFVVAANDSLHKNMADYVCGGVNDHLVIQAAIDALPATGGEVFLLEGTYYIESSLVLDSYQTLRGCDRNTILTTTTADIDIITATGGAGTEKVGILIADLCVDGTAGGSTVSLAINFTYVDDSKVQSVWALNCTSWGGIGLTNCDFNEMIGNIFRNSGEAFYLETSNSNIIASNSISGGDFEGIYLDSSHNNTISGNNCQGNVGHGIYVAGSNSNTVSGNNCQGNGDNGISAAGDNNIVSDNNCQGNGNNGIGVVGDNNIVSGNNCQRNSNHGISVSGDNNIVSGNNCQGNSQILDNIYDNINLAISDYSLIEGNLCRAPTIGTTLTALEPIGETEIAVTDTAGFEVGMGVVIDLGGVLVEYHRISAITAGAPGVITIDAGLISAQAIGETIDVPEARYGINISDTDSENNVVKNNDFYDSGKTANFNDEGILTYVEDNNRGIEIIQIKHYRRVKNTSGGAMAVGDVTSLKAVAAGNEITPPVAVGERQVYGMVAEVIADTASGLVQVKGFTNALKGTNVGGGNIAIGDNLITENGVRARKATADTDPIFARALEVCNAADVTIDAYIKSPWD